MSELIFQAFPEESVDSLDVLISGDTHVPRLEYRDEVLFVNSGSPTLPYHLEWRHGSAALLNLTSDGIVAEIVSLGETPNRPNPIETSSLVIHR